jgi:hypothetical protein
MNCEAMTLNIFYECIRYLVRAAGDIFCTHRKTHIPRKSVLISRDSCVRVRHCVMENKVMQIRSDQTERQCTYKVTLRRVHATNVAVEKRWVLHNPSVLLVNLVIKHATRTRHIVINVLSRASRKVPAIFVRFLTNILIWKNFWKFCPVFQNFSCVQTEGQADGHDDNGSQFLELVCERK